MGSFPERVVGLVEQQEDDQKHDWDDQFESLPGADLVFILSAPFDVVALRHFDLAGHGALSIGDKAPHITSSDIHKDGATKQPIFAGNHAWSHDEPDVRYLTQWNLGSV